MRIQLRTPAFDVIQSLHIWKVNSDMVIGHGGTFMVTFHQPVLPWCYSKFEINSHMKLLDQSSLHCRRKIEKKTELNL